MKKTIILIIMVWLCSSLCSCGEAKDNEKDNKNTHQAIEMKMNIYEAAINLQDSNYAVIQSMKASTEEESIIYFTTALNLVKYAKEKVKLSISSHNFISEGLDELEENYEKTLQLLKEISTFSEEEMDEFVSRIVSETDQHVTLMIALYSFTDLCEIRKFDQVYDFNKLSDDEIQVALQEEWWMFGFDENIQCPENISKEELYLLWAKQTIKKRDKLLEGYQSFGEFDEDEFLEELQNLRRDENLESKEYNAKWVEFIEKFIFNAKGNSD